MLPYACSSKAIGCLCWQRSLMWETDFYTPPVLEGAALSVNSAPAVYKIMCPKDPEFYTLALNNNNNSTSKDWRCMKIRLPESPVSEKAACFLPSLGRGSLCLSHELLFQIKLPSRGFNIHVYIYRYIYSYSLKRVNRMSTFSPPESS